MATDRSPRSPGSSTDEPSKAEVQQRVSSLYDRAESDTGAYNITRAQSSRSRGRVTSVANSGRGSTDPSLEAVAKQWFDVARGRVGPVTPAVLPADRRPARPAPTARPASAPERPTDRSVVREPEAATRRVPELTARAVAALPAAPEPRRQESRALLPAVPAQAPAPVPARAGTPAAAPTDRQSSLKNTKEQIGRKLSTARDVLARALAQPMPSLPAPALPAPSSPAPSLSTPSLSPSAQPTAVLPTIGTQPAESLPLQQPWDTAEQQAFRAEISAAWAGRSQVAAPGTVSPTGADGLLPTGEPNFAAPVSGFMTSDTAFSAPAPEYLAPELGYTTPPSGYPIPELGLPIPESGYTTPDVAAPVAPVPGYPAPELGFATAPSAYTTSELPLTVTASGFAATGLTPSAPLPGYQDSAADMLTAGAGHPASPGLAAPAAPLPPAAPPVVAPADLTVSATGTAYLGKADKALAFARAQIGRPCVWGATGPESYDCSSLTQAAWRTAGVTLPRSAIDQAKAFTRISLAELRPGDLVFFFDDLSHTGLCTGNGMMIHAPGPGTYIREEAILPFGEGALRGAVRPA
ncbi:C40 family peptidase [Streptomyces rishiriensis]|uniref:Cell wall-associated NlpC family hydrolase n=1 Tax=Streptomyces rishiriensis TaxID=68264 RepID=A0ABU0P2F8_STRRH|nr:C40 family peptidase [Streptomyces rishiriensis]MDQ0585113.1 cell wall-associated NlpC family hydrolase [Streptomyces rishiriensis]